MNDLPRRKLKELLATHGQGLCTDWRRCRSLLKEQCPQDKKEIDVLIETLRNDRVEEELVTLPPGADVVGLLPQLTAQLQEDSEMSEADARWGVESWAMALGLLPLPEPPPAAAAPPPPPPAAKEEAPPPVTAPAPAEVAEPEPLPAPAPPAAPSEGAVAADRLADRSAFYLGREYDLPARKPLPGPEHEIHYPSRYLVTHGVVVGMTGSGKTGLCISLLEEAAIDGIPCIVIDLKGDLTNLLLQFPELRPEDFKEWLDPEDARQKSIPPEKYAAQLAASWRKGIEESGQPLARIKELKESSEWRIYTPGSEAGLPLSVLKNFAAPKGRVAREVVAQKLDATTTALLSLTGIASDPVQSREHILIAQLLQAAWNRKMDLTLKDLVGQVREPPLGDVGSLPLDEFYPPKERMKLAAALNNILASPSFETWITGEPLDLAKMMYSAEGKPRQLIFYLAHLDDAQRMFFITLLLDEVVSWMRKQQGTSSLRALLYFDEVFGYLPPYPANPPTKQPLMTLLKQARAFGVGVLLATQNPVDLDYKALSNAGTWFVGKLQTERDKARLIEGLESVAAERGTRSAADSLAKMITALGNRIFLLHSIHASEPRPFQTRWALSYLRGPVTLDQIPRLLELTGVRRETPVTEQPEEGASPPAPGSAGEVRAAIPVAAPAEAGPVPVAIPVATPANPGGALAAIPLRAADPLPDLKLEPVVSSAPTVPAPAVAGVTQFYLATAGARPAQAQVVYQPRVLGVGEVVFADRRRNLEYRRTYRFLALPPSGDGNINWETAEASGIALADAAEPAVQWGAVPESLNSPKKLKSLEKAFWDFLYSTRKLPLWLNRALDLVSQPGEELADFRERCRTAVAGELERALENERIKFEPKFKRLGVELPEKRGGSVLSWLIFGASDAHLTPKQKVQLRDLDNDWKRKRQELEDRWKQAGDDCAELQLTPRKVDVEVRQFGLAWAPYWRVPNPAGWTDELPAYR
jgi:hypothetical protein